MNYRKTFIASVLCIFSLNSIVAAQTPNRRPRTGTTPPKTQGAKPKPTPTTPQQPAATTVPAPPGTLAILNGQPITLADLDPKVRASVEGFDKEMMEMRKTALEEQISAYLLEAEAKKRKVTLEQLFEAEVNSRLTQPAETEMRAFFDANRAQIGTDDYTSVRQQISDYLRQQSAQKLIGDLTNRLRLTTAVKMGADPNATGLAPATVLATVGSRAITKGYLDERLKPFIYKRRLEIYTSEMDALNFKIYETLLIAEAKRRNTTKEAVFQAEVTDKVKPPTEADVNKFYEENRARIQGDLPSLRDQISAFLLQQEQRKLVFDLNKRLRAAANLQVLLTEPEPPVQAVSSDDDPAHGPVTAPVTIVVFTDFQCPACAAAHPVVEETAKSYGTRVRLVVRDFPLINHANARKAAEAANAANAQGKFFEYIAVLFKNQSALDVPSLKSYAASLGLNTARFNAALDSGEYAAEVEHDVEDGMSYGIDGTPAVYINGVRLRDITAEALRAAIDRALARAAR